MLRFYVPIDEDEIFKLHKTLEHLVCEVWCEADKQPINLKLNPELKNLTHYSYRTGVSFFDEIERIYEHFVNLDSENRNKISEAFKQADQVENLCNKTTKAILLEDLPEFVDKDIKPLFKWCYEELLDKQKVSGDKLKYYKNLIGKNNYLLCPCCGLIDFEDDDEENEVREAYDHYLPKSIFPFASVNFKNLVPLCYKCNSDRKKAKNPIENDRKAFYPFSLNSQSTSINIKIDQSDNIEKLERDNLEISFHGDKDRIETWDWLFGISIRYNSTIRGFSKSFLRRIKRRHDDFKECNDDWTYTKSLDKLISDYKHDQFEDKKFLKIPYMEELKNLTNLIQVYE